MTPFECYRTYLALKSHFEQKDYDFFRYQGSVRANEASYARRNDRYSFEKIAKKHDPQGFMLANILAGNTYVRDMTTPEGEDLYSKWLKIKESLHYHFTQQVEQVSEQFNSHFICNHSTHPEVIKKYYREELSLETLCILTQLTRCLQYWDGRMGDDLLYQDLRMKIVKYTPFIEYDREKCITILKNKVDR